MVINAAIEGVRNQLIPYDKNFTEVFAQTYHGEPLLIKNLVEEVLAYKLQAITNPYWHTAALLFMFAFGFSIVALVLSPAAEAWVAGVFRSAGKHAGRVGELLIVAGVIAAMFYLYFQVYTHGPETLLPPAWR